jgi:F0F1-type ATP synthase assembly protein I
MQAAQRPTLDPAGAGAILVTFLAIGAGIGALIGWAAGSVGIGILVGVIVGIPAGVLAVYRRYRGAFS